VTWTSGLCLGRSYIVCSIVVLQACITDPSGGLSPSVGAHVVERDYQPLSKSSQSGTLLYVSADGFLDTYTYPRGVQQQHINTGAAAKGLCVDPRGNIFVTDYNNARILEYAHGGASPIAILSDPLPKPIACSVDPVSGNLAVANYAGATDSESGSVVVFREATGSGTIYRARGLFFYVGCSYGRGGDLFVDGQSSRFAPAIAELSPASKTFKRVALPSVIRGTELPGGIQWAGHRLIFGDVDQNKLFALDIAASRATVVSVTKLRGGNQIFQFTLFGRRLIAPNNGTGSVGVWLYPSGRALNTIDVGYGVFGVAISP
jgi:hypothetical protein